MSDKLSDILNQLKSINKSLEKSYFIPSRKEEIVVKPLTAIHTKNILKTTVHGAFVENQFCTTLYHILKEICGPVADTLSIFDKDVLLLQIRQSNVGDNLELELYGPKNKKIKENVSLEEHIKNIRETSFEFPDTVFSLDSITVKLNYPTIQEQFFFESFFWKEKISKLSTPPTKQESIDLVTPIFLINLAQFVKEIEIGSDQFIMASRSIDERLVIIENLPHRVLKRIIEEIDVLGDKMKNLLEVNKKVSKKDEKEELYKGHIIIDPSFFLA